MSWVLRFTFHGHAYAVGIVALVILGLATGIIAGMFGVGGGFFLTPFLMYGLGIPPEIAVGSALSQKCGTSMSSFLKFRKVGLGEPLFDIIMIGGSVMGADLGTRIQAALSEAPDIFFGHGLFIRADQLAVDLLFLVMLLITGLSMGREALHAMKTPVLRGDVTIPGPLTKIRIPPYIDMPRVGLKQISVPVLCYLGMFLGVLSALLGIGGGVIFTPVLLYGYGLSARNAAGTGILLLFVTVAYATYRQALHGFVSLPLALCILAGSGFGTIIGTEITMRTKNRYLRLLFAALILLTCLGIVYDLVTSIHHGR